jgi:U32 family peptidase
MKKKIDQKNPIEIMSPVGSYEALHAAIKAGANSIYFGAANLNMRSGSSKNFDLEDLKKIVKICIKNNVKSYLTLNTIMYDKDLVLMKKIIDTAKLSKITAIIISDISAMMYAKEKKVEIHISTQANVSNFEAVKFYSQFADVIVLARELTLQQVKTIVTLIKKENVCGPNGKLIQIELFAHGAMCVAISGKCHMSLTTYNSSANRGKCLQNCRRKYKVTDVQTGNELAINNNYVMSPKDMCTINFIDKIIETGTIVLKLEGRGRSPEYVYTVTKCYREAVDSYYTKTYSKEKIKSWLNELKSVYNRGFWNGYYHGKTIDTWSNTFGTKATKEKKYVGKCQNYFKKNKIAQFILEAGKIKKNDEIIITGTTTGVIKSKIKKLFVNDVESDSANKGDVITIPISELVRENDLLYVYNKKLKKNSI